MGQQLQLVADDAQVCCGRCAMRARLDRALARVGIVHLTMVVDYDRTPHGIGVFERARAHIALRGTDRLLHGSGHSREDALRAALVAFGVIP